MALSRLRILRFACGFVFVVVSDVLVGCGWLRGMGYMTSLLNGIISVSRSERIARPERACVSVRTRSGSNGSMISF